MASDWKGNPYAVKALAWLRRALPWLYACALAWVGVYICREAFFTESTGHFNSMHGEWLALARIAGLDWYSPRWWPYWGGGAPIEFAYAPLIPVLIAALARVLHSSPALALNIVMGSVYCLLPLGLYFGAWRLTRAPGYSFLAALLGWLASPPDALDASRAFGLAWFATAHRTSRLFEWDDLPHLASLALFPIAVWLLARALNRRRSLDYALAGAVMAVMMFDSMFGFVLCALAVVTVPAALGERCWRSGFPRAALLAVAAYVVVSPWAPPSLLRTVGADALSDGEADWSARGFLALGILAVAWLCVWLVSRRFIRDWGVRWIALFACPAILIPALDHYLALHFLPQPQRYVVEMEWAMGLCAAFAARPALRRIPYRWRALLAFVFVCLAVRQVVVQRRYVKFQLRPVEVAQSIEYRAAQWVAAALPGQRVMMTGSMATWLNAFTDSPQLSAQSYSTAPNQAQQLAQYAIFSGLGMGDRDAEFSLLWLKAFGAQAVDVPGPQSPEYWKPFVHPRKFDGLLPVLWRQDDTAIYRVPQASASLAHVALPSQLMSRRPANLLDDVELRRYVAALDNPAAPASFEWRGQNRALIRARLEAGQVVSVQVNYDPGWRASVNGSPRAIYRDGIGLMAVEARCAGECEIALDFDGGWEAMACRAASPGVLLLAGLLAWRRRASGPVHA